MTAGLYILPHNNGRAGSVHILKNPGMAINLYMCGAGTHRFEAIREQFTKLTFWKFGMDTALNNS